MKNTQSILCALVCLSLFGCDSAVGYDDDALAAERGERVVYVDWDERPDQLWDKGVEAPLVLTIRSNEKQLAVYGVDAANGTLEFALLANVKSYGDVRKVVEEGAVMQGIGPDFNQYGVPGRHTGGPPLPVGPGGGDAVPQAIEQLTVETGLFLHKTMGGYADEHAVIFGDKK